MGRSTRKKPVIGIIGGVCCGKSTVAQEFERLGCAVIDADAIAHRLLGQEEIKTQVIDITQDTILDKKGEIDRKKLAKTVFADGTKLQKLSRILHPRVLESADAMIAQLQEQQGVKAIVLDMPLLVEVGWDSRCDHVIFVESSLQNRQERAERSGFLGASEVETRENFQISLDNKKLIADTTLVNNSDFSGLSRQVAEIFSHIISDG